MAREISLESRCQIWLLGQREMSDLTFVATAELLGELMCRETFLGIVIKSVNEITTCGNTPEIDPGGFEIHCKNLSPSQALDLLLHCR